MFEWWGKRKAEGASRRQAQRAEWEREFTAAAMKTRTDALGVFREIAGPLVAAGKASLLWDSDQEMLTLLPGNESGAPLRLRLPARPAWNDIQWDFTGIVLLITGSAQHQLDVPCYDRDFGWLRLADEGSSLRDLICSVVDGKYREEVAADGTVTLVFGELRFPPDGVGATVRGMLSAYQPRATSGVSPGGTAGVNFFSPYGT